MQLNCVDGIHVQIRDGTQYSICAMCDDVKLVQMRSTNIHSLQVPLLASAFAAQLCPQVSSALDRSLCKSLASSQPYCGVPCPYLPTVPECPGQSRIYCCCPLSHTEDVIYLECPGNSGHQLPRPSQVLVQ